MTNSIASAKCPSVLTSGNYGMSQNRYTDDASKEYIFVKLTDSAYRAVEEYQRNEHAKRFAANGQCAKIQFNGNSGIIHFPTSDGSAEGRKFCFAIDDVEGSLECIQQTQHELDVLGALSYRMRIHANEDIYDATRTKMAIAEETEKSKCIREIKPNQTDIGRKVKKAIASTSASASVSASTFNHIGNNGNSNSSNIISSSSSSNLSSSSNSRSKLMSMNSSAPLLNGGTAGGASKFGSSAANSSRSPNPTQLGGSGTIGAGSSGNTCNSNNSNNRYGSHTTSSSSSSLSSSMQHSNLYGHSSNASSASSLPPLMSASSLSSTLAGGIANGYASASAVSRGSPPEHTMNKSKFLGGSANARNAHNTLSGSKGSAMSGNKSSGGSSNASGGSKLPDISRRKIRERLIHLLALKPFKKPELYSRLQNEGLRDRERSLITNILKDIATLSRDNTYNLRRQMWNDVNENWPYYTEQELQQLKRRKPQNLTPPLSSDAGSSTSGQSPTSTHTGSPPPIVGGNGGGGGLKRASLESDRYEDTFMSGVQPKKQRISHYKKDIITASSNSNGGGGGGSSGNSASQRMHYNSNSNSNSYLQQSRHATAYSPHGVHSNQAVDENSGNSDLSYNVLDNTDFMSHMEQNSYYGNTNSSNQYVRSKPSGSAGSSKSASATAKEKRNANAGGYSNPERERSNKKELAKKSAALASSSSSPTLYAGSFVPVASGGKAGNGRGEANGNSNGSQQQRQSPNFGAQYQQQQQQQQHHKTNSVIFSPQTQMPLAGGSSEDNPGNVTRGISGSSGSSSNLKNQQSSRSSSKSVRTPTPPVQQLHQPQQPQQQHHHQQQQLPPPAPQSQHHYQQHYHSQHQQQQQQHASPTQQIAAAVSSFAATSAPLETPSYDFSNYTRITSIEQRRKYKTEFESDYDEYRKLLAQIEGVGKRFRGLAEKLENAGQGCPDYYTIKQQIVSEYERICNEETLRRDKQRFDYLHEKLAHIKQLVTEYDRTLTSGTAPGVGTTVAPVAAQQQHHHHQQLQQHQAPQSKQAASQQQQQQRTLHQHQSHYSQLEAVENANMLSTHKPRLSPMVSGESNNSPPLSYHHQQLQQQQQQQQHASYQQQRLNDLNALQAAAADHHASQQQNGQEHHHQQHPHYNGHHTAHSSRSKPRSNDSDSDDSSSESNSNDDDEDDDDEDDDDDSNSNDDDDDNDHDHDNY